MLFQSNTFYFHDDIRQNDRLGHHSLALYGKMMQLKWMVTQAANLLHSAQHLILFTTEENLYDDGLEQHEGDYI